MAFNKVEGKRDSKAFTPASAAVITVGDVLQFDEGGDVIVGATGDETLGIALEASASGETAEILVDILHGGDVVDADISTGTMADAEVGEEADLEDEDSLTLTESNNDVIIVGWDGSNTAKCRVVFKNLVYGA